MHFTAIALGVAAAIAGLVLTAYNPLYNSLGCWVEPYPRGCIDESAETNDNTCERGASAPVLAFWGVVMPLIFVWAFLLLNNLLLYLHVRSTELRSRHFSMRRHSSLPTQQPQSRQQQSSDDLGPRRSSDDLRIPPNVVATFSTPANGSADNGEEREETVEQAATSAAAGQSIHSAVAPSVTSSTVVREPTSLSQKVASQSFFYVAAFFMSYFPSFVLFCVENAEPGPTYFGLQVLVGALLPMQGLFNFLVYLRPYYLQKRRRQQQQQPGGGCFHSRLDAFYKAALHPLSDDAQSARQQQAQRGPTTLSPHASACSKGKEESAGNDDECRADESRAHQLQVISSNSSDLEDVSAS
ncbi:MAG: hypothetical protein SGARI_002324 [Bacillariaceae sp.]